ncbi:Uncharacterised protein [uncultured archaeon]|nr:Uncharacterised protein [uncultured archaeon]
MNPAGGVGWTVNEEELLAAGSLRPSLGVDLRLFPQISDLAFDVLSIILSCHLGDHLQFLRKTICFIANTLFSLYDL